MKKSLVVVLWLASIPACFAQAEAEILKGDDLKKVIIGRTIFISTLLGEVPVRYNRNGTMTASTSASFAAIAGERVTTDKGQWWIAGNKLCQRWRNWVEKQTFCYEMRGDTRSVIWKRSDGKTGSARVGS